MRLQVKLFVLAKKSFANFSFSVFAMETMFIENDKADVSLP